MMSNIIDVVVLFTFFTMIPICWFYGISFNQLHSMDTQNWRILWWIVGAVMFVAALSDIVIRFALNDQGNFGPNLVGSAVAIYCIFLWSRCIHIMVRK